MAIRIISAFSAREKHTLTQFAVDQLPVSGDRSAGDATTSRRRRLSILLSLGSFGLSLVSLGGCSMFGAAGSKMHNHEFLDEFMLNHRNAVLAKRAWYREQHCRKDHCHKDHVKRGFMDAYMDVANGGPGCVPAVAPRDYWGWRYQSSDGNAAVNAWFEGYPLGVKAAEQDNVGTYSNIQTSNFSTRTSNSPIGATPLGGSPTMGAPIGAAELIPVPGGFINSTGQLVDADGKVIGKASVQDRAVDEIDVPAGESDTLTRPADLTPESPQAVDRGDDFGMMTPIPTGAAGNAANYQLDRPSKSEINAVIDDIFGKSEARLSDQTPAAQPARGAAANPFVFE